MLWKTMTRLGIPARLVRLVKACMQYSKCKVKFNRDLSKEFSVDIGLRQGDDALSSVLFNIGLGQCERYLMTPWV